MLTILSGIVPHFNTIVEVMVCGSILLENTSFHLSHHSNTHLSIPGLLTVVPIDSEIECPWALR